MRNSSLTFAPLVVLISAGLVGCASTGFDPGSTVKIVDATAVVNCRYLDDVHGTSGYYGIFANRGFEIARKRALLQAAKIGATHIVWLSPTQGYGSTEVHAKAYRCPE